MVICLEQGADLHMAQLMPMPLTVSCFSKIQIGFTFLVPAHPGSPGKRAVEWVCVYVCLYVCVCVCVTASLSPEQQGRTSTICVCVCVCVLPMAVSWSFSGDVAVRLLARFYAMALCLCLCLSVCHQSEFYRNGWMSRAGFWLGSFLPPILHCVKRKFGYLQN